MVVLAALGTDARAMKSCAMLAEATGLSEPTVSKILKQLGKVEIVKSVRGINGGYRLGRAIEAISIRDVIAAIDGPVAITSCVDVQASECSLSDVCRVHGRWGGVNDAIRAALEQVSLADMITKTHNNAVQGRAKTGL